MVLGDKDIPNLSLLRFLRILRLIRILRTFKLLGGVSGIKRQLITLSLTLLSLTFMAGGVVQVMENDVKQLSYDCKYINEFTNYEPSCKMFEPVDDATCDCAKYSCQPGYSSSDHNGEPSYIRCNDLPYFNCFYFIVVTMATVGYGDIYPTSGPSKVVIILFIITSLIVIPMQVNKLTLLLSMSSAFRSTYTPQHHENHVIICGHVTDAAKLERLFKEFFHPGRHFASAPDFHLVVLSPLEPPEEVRTLLVSPLFDSRVTYIIGSALSTEDLQRTRADIASAMFFVCNVEVQTQEAFFDDAATVLRTLSVNNFNRDLTCLVQVLRSEDRDILKDSDVDVVLCLDEFKTAMQARNAICPGLSTFIENIFHTFTSPHNQIEDSSYWMNEYIHGARMEMYFIPLEKGFLEAMNFDWDLLCEAVYVEFGRILAGVASVEKHSMIFNPGEFELQSYFNAEEFYSVYNVAVIMAMSQDEANSIAAALADYQALDRIMVRMLAVEEDFAVRKLPTEKGHKLRTSASLLGRYSLGTARVAVETSFKDIISYSKMKKMFKKDAVSIVSDNTTRQYPADLGLPSRRVDDASRLTDHIIVFGCVENVHLFVHELRRNLIQGHSYRPVVIMSEVEPIRWDIIKSSYKDIYFIENSITSSAGFNASNVRDAFGIILLASRDSVTMVEEENLDAETLFAFLKLERYVPRYVFFTVELTCSNNMSVLNSTIMRRSRGVVVNSKKYASRQVHDAAFNATVADDNSRNKSALQHSQVRGTFSSQRKVVSAKGGTSGKAPKGNPGARINPISVDSDKSKAHKKDNFQASRNFWDLHGTHHVLPVFAAGRSYVPSVFDTLLCQSFFSSLAPLMCERLVCGEGSQTIFQEPVPSPYIDHMFVDLFRAFRSRGILVLGLYRSSLMSTGSALPYVFTSPWADTTLRSGDMVYVYGHPVSIAEVILDISKTFVQNKKGNFGLACAIDGVTGAGRTRQRSVTRANIPVRRAAYMAKGTSGSFQTPHRERSMRDVRSFESKPSFEAGEEKAEVDVNSYHPRQRRRSGEGGSVRSYRSQENSVLINCNSNSDIEEFPEDLVKKTKPPSVLAVKSSDALEFDPDAKGFKAFQAVMKGYIARKEVKEKYNWERKIKKNEHGVQQFIDQKHEKGNTSKEHDMAIMIQKQVRGHSSRSKSLKQLLK
jgi:potassium large conductance calcium-activated channel subfamily M alpha protein 1